MTPNEAPAQNSELRGGFVLPNQYSEPIIWGKWNARII